MCHQGVWANDRLGHAEPNSWRSLVFSIIEAQQNLKLRPTCAPVNFASMLGSCSCSGRTGELWPTMLSLLTVAMQDPPLEMHSEGK